jgi:hypothetical protein
MERKLVGPFSSIDEDAYSSNAAGRICVLRFPTKLRKIAYNP